MHYSTLPSTFIYSSHPTHNPLWISLPSSVYLRLTQQATSPTQIRISFAVFLCSVGSSPTTFIFCQVIPLQVIPRGYGTEQALNRLLLTGDGWRCISFHLQITKDKLWNLPKIKVADLWGLYYYSIVTMYLIAHVLGRLKKKSYYSGGISQVFPQYCELIETEQQSKIK